MPNKYHKLISEHAKRRNELHRLVHASYANRKRDELAWKSACEHFRSHASAVDTYMHKIYTTPKFEDVDLIEFAICFLEVNPLFFRSGYVKEVMLRKLKQSKLNNEDAIRLRKVIVKAVENVGLREYRLYCKLAAVLVNQELKDSILKILKTGNESQKSRAKYMLKYLSDRKHNQS